MWKVQILTVAQHLLREQARESKGLPAEDY